MTRSHRPASPSPGIRERKRGACSAPLRSLLTWCYDCVFGGTLATNRELHLLHLTPRYYARPTTGAELRCHHLGVSLARCMRVTHVGFSRPGENPSPEQISPTHRLIPVDRETRYRKIDLLRGALGSIPFSVLNYTRGDMERALAAVLRNEPVDIVLLESVHMGGYLPLLRRLSPRPPLIACDWHNIESEILRRYAESSPGLARALYARRAAASLESYERRFVNRCDMHVAVSERDRRALVACGTRVPIVIVEKRRAVGRVCRAAQAIGRAFFASCLWEPWTTTRTPTPPCASATRCGRWFRRGYRAAFSRL